MVAQSEKTVRATTDQGIVRETVSVVKFLRLHLVGWSKIEIHARVRAVIVGYPPASIRGRIIRVIDRRILREPGSITAYPRTN